MLVKPYQNRLLGGFLICMTKFPSIDFNTTAKTRSTTYGLKPVGMVAVVAIVTRTSELG